MKNASLKILSFLLCFTAVLLSVGCKKTANTSSSDVSEYVETIIVEDDTTESDDTASTDKKETKQADKTTKGTSRQMKDSNNQENTQVVAQPSSESVQSVESNTQSEEPVKKNRVLNEPAGNYVSLDGKKVMFIGNSLVYYGWCVVNQNIGKQNKGYFYQLCDAHGEDTEVIAYVYPNKSISSIYNDSIVPLGTDLDYDYVVMSEGGMGSYSHLLSVYNTVKKSFVPKTKFILLSNSYPYEFGMRDEMETNNKILKNAGVTIVNWGALVSDIWEGLVSVPDATLKYNQNSFMTDGKDQIHPNPLSGYITAVMTYCAITGRSAVYQPYDFCNDMYLNYWFDFMSFKLDYYTKGNSNFESIFKSEKDMKGILTLCDEYIKKYN